jgi:group I intron endonuclease
MAQISLFNSGIYAITNRKTGKRYIGSTKNLSKRQKVHFDCLRRGVHSNVWLQRSYVKHGRKAFVFDVLEYCNEQSLFEREKHYIDSVRSSGEKLYNIGSVGGGDNLTLHPDRESIIKRRAAAAIGRKGKPTHGEKNPNWRGGKPKCQKCKKEMQRANKGGFCKECRTRDGKKNSFFGKSHSEETKRKIADSHKGLKKPANSRPVLLDGKWYESVKEAARQLNVCSATICYRIKSKNYDYKYA